MLSSNPNSSGPGNPGGPNSKKQQKKKQKQANVAQKGYIPPDFFGPPEKVTSIIVKHPSTFQIPLGYPVDKMFDYIVTNQYGEIETLLKGKFNLNIKLFEGAYIPYRLALYHKYTATLKDFQSFIVSYFDRMGAQGKPIAAKIKKVKDDIFGTIMVSSIDDALNFENGETFDDNPIAKAQAIMALDFNTIFTSFKDNIIETVLSKSGGNKGKKKRYKPKKPSTSAPATAPPKTPATAPPKAPATAPPKAPATAPPKTPSSNPKPGKTITPPANLAGVNQDCGYFEQQSASLLSCGRHAINNILGGPYFVKTAGYKVDFVNPTFPMSLPKFCTEMRKIAKTLKVEELFPECLTEENYDVNVLLYALHLTGFDISSITESSNPANEYEDLKTISTEFHLLINLGIETESGGKAGAHWVAANSIPSTGTFCYYDSLAATPRHFATRLELIDYVASLNPIYIAVLGTKSDKSLNPETVLRERANEILSVKTEESKKKKDEEDVKKKEEADKKKEEADKKKEEADKKKAEQEKVYSNQELIDFLETLSEDRFPNLEPKFGTSDIFNPSSYERTTGEESVPGESGEEVSGEPEEDTESNPFKGVTSPPKSVPKPPKEDTESNPFKAKPKAKRTPKPSDIFSPGEEEEEEEGEYDSDLGRFSNVPNTTTNPFSNPSGKVTNPFASSSSSSTTASTNPFKGGARYDPNNILVTSLPLTTTPTPPSPFFVKIPAISINYLTPLQFAVGYGSASTVSQLIRYNADFKVTTMNRIPLANIASERPNERQKDRVVVLLKDVSKAYDDAYFDFNLRQMKKDYVEEVSVSEETRKNLREFKDSINVVYSKTYKAIKSGKSTTDVLGEIGEAALKRGKQDSLDDKPEDVTQTKNDSKEVREGYILGYKIGEAEKAGTADGQAKVANPRNPYYSDPKTPLEIKNAYMSAYQKIKGANIYRGFKDGVTGKEKNPPGTQFLQFDQKLSDMLNLGVSDKAAIDEYDAGYNMGLQDFVANLPDIINNAEPDGELDGFNGKPRYSTKHKIKVKPLQGGIVMPGAQPTLSSMEYGKEEEIFEIDYSELDLKPKYAVIPSIQINSTKYGNIPMSGPNFAYGAYIQMMYKYGFTQGRLNKDKSGKGRSKTYRKKHTSKTKTYKKKLTKK